MQLFNRRRFLVMLGASTLSGFYLTRCTSGQAQSLSTSTNHLISVDGLLDVSLNATVSSVRVAGRQATLLAFNNQVPGPRLEVKPGDTVRIRFTNSLSESTNLHYHGLHVSPNGNADNVFLDIPPGETITYEFDIPSHHPGGTFWYHPHRHGLVADQVWGGLAGLFIVRGELDQIPEIQAASETFLVFKDFALTCIIHEQWQKQMDSARERVQPRIRE